MFDLSLNIRIVTSGGGGSVGLRVRVLGVLMKVCNKNCQGQRVYKMQINLGLR
jgi:hypothetical protein